MIVWRNGEDAGCRGDFSLLCAALLCPAGFNWGWLIYPPLTDTSFTMYRGRADFRSEGKRKGKGKGKDSVSIPLSVSVSVDRDRDRDRDRDKV